MSIEKEVLEQVRGNQIKRAQLERNKLLIEFAANNLAIKFEWKVVWKKKPWGHDMSIEIMAEILKVGTTVKKSQSNATKKHSRLTLSKMKQKQFESAHQAGWSLEINYSDGSMDTIEWSLDFSGTTKGCGAQNLRYNLELSQ